MEKRKSSVRYAPEVRKRAVRMVLEHAAIMPRNGKRSARSRRRSAARLGCTAEMLRKGVRQAERERGMDAGPTSTEQTRIKALEREVRELRQANEIVRKASAYFAMAELARSSRP